MINDLQNAYHLGDVDKNTHKHKDRAEGAVDLEDSFSSSAAPNRKGYSMMTALETPSDLPAWRTSLEHPQEKERVEKLIDLFRGLARYV